MSGTLQSRLADGSIDFSGGVDSGRVSTLRSDQNPNGLSRNQLAWLQNGTVRGGGIAPRTGWQYVTTILPNPETYGGGFMYQPPNDLFPYLVLVIGGKLLEVRVDSNNAVNHVVPVPAIVFPQKNGYTFAQSEEFLVIQPNDFTTKPIFYYPAMPFTGAMLTRQSKGIIGVGDPTNELPAAGPMDYYQGRLWYARGRKYTAGDIVGNQASGTLAYEFRDSVLHVTENPLAVGGDGFTVPAQDGNIRALAHTSNVNVQLGEGQFYIFTRKSVYSLSVPISRNAWISSSTNTQPTQTVVTRRFGAVGDRCVVPLNGDLYYRTMEPGIRSLQIAVRDAKQWGNTPISRNVNRILALDDRSLLRNSPGMEFNNRLWQACQPVDLPGVGAGFRSVVTLDFDLVSSLEDKLAGPGVPAWEGAYEGLDILQLFTGDFGGRDRAFAVVFSRVTGAIELWELTDYARRENGDNRIRWYFETPSYTWGEMFSMKELDGAEIWVDQLSGTCDFKAFYRTDQNGCWTFWHAWQDCASRGTQEDVPAGAGYPEQSYCDQYRAPYVLPKPPRVSVPGMNRPSNWGYQFQMRLEVYGWCRVRGVILYAQPRMRAPFADKFVG